MTRLRGIDPQPARGQKRTRYVTPVFTATVFKHNGEPITMEAYDIHPAGPRRTSDIVSCRTSKSVRSPMGTFSMVAVPRKLDYFEEIDVGDWCEIKSDNGDGKGLRPLMYGPITDVRDSKLVDQKGAVIRRIHITGADFGKVFTSMCGINDAKLAGDPAFTNLGLGALASSLKTAVGSPSTMVKKIIDIFLNALTQWVDPRTGRTFGLGTLDVSYISNTLGNAVPEIILLSGNLWQILMQWANVAMNEMFVDYRPPASDPGDFTNLTPAFILRQFPFYGDDWNFLTSVVVDTDEVRSSELGKSESDVRNWIRVHDDPRLTATRDGIVVYLEKAGTVNAESIKRFGYKRYEPTTQYIFDPGGIETVTSDFVGPPATTPPKSIPNILQEMSSWNTLWHHSNELLVNGTIETYHLPDVRVGYRYDLLNRETGKNMEFYVEAVSHTLQFPGESSTLATVTRGRDPNDKRFSDYLDKLIADGVVQELGSTIDRVGDALKGGEAESTEGVKQVDDILVTSLLDQF